MKCGLSQQIGATVLRDHPPPLPFMHRLHIRNGLQYIYGNKQLYIAAVQILTDIFRNLGRNQRHVLIKSLENTSEQRFCIDILKIPRSHVCSPEYKSCNNDREDHNENECSGKILCHQKKNAYSKELGDDYEHRHERNQSTHRDHDNINEAEHVSDKIVDNEGHYQNKKACQYAYSLRHPFTAHARCLDNGFGLSICDHL